MKRTTVLLDDALLIEAQALAEQQSMTFTSLLTEALRTYIQANRAPRRISCIGIGRSDRPRDTLCDGGDEAELRAGIDPVEGWSPQRWRQKDGERDRTNVPTERPALPAPER